MGIQLGRALNCLMCTVVVSTVCAQDAEEMKPASALNPIDGVVEAFGSHSVVAITEGVGHGNEKGHDFLRALIRDPRFLSAVDDVMVEWGNSLYQDVIDRFTRGDDVPFSELRKVWENTTQPHPVWDSPVYLEFFRTVRSQNEVLPDEEKIRVLLGDPPIDWDADSPRRELTLERDAHAAELIQDQVVGKGRRVLVVYGGLHLLRLPSRVYTIAEPLVAHLEREGIKVFNVWGVPVDVAAEIEPRVAGWDPVRMTIIANTPLGAAGFQRYFPSAEVTPMREQFDALMIFGRRSEMTWSQLSPELCNDQHYIEMRARRMSYDDSQEFVHRYCAQESED